MDVRKVTEDLSVAPQISADEVAEIAAAGFKTIICNRPDGEDALQPGCQAISDAASRLGVAVVHQPVVSGQLGMADVVAFKKLVEDAQKPVLAYCRSGTRCVTLWGLSQAGNLSSQEIIGAAAIAGYDLSGLAATLDSLAQQK
ncbi:MAG: TIGR01244 family phosphatase [Alphaproteobacteria bacterium]|nr:TIGR01244 family phosphatase [Alphaproteobacteria bacterium]